MLDEFNLSSEGEFVFKAQLDGVKLQTFPPIMTVLGVHCLLGSFLMPGGEIKRSMYVFSKILFSLWHAQNLP